MNTRAEIVDGRAIANTIAASIREITEKMDDPLYLALVTVGDDPVSANFVKYKKKFARRVGVETTDYEFDESITESELIEQIKIIQDHSDGVVIQLPLPNHINTESVLNILEMKKDPDVLGVAAYAAFENDGDILPPVTGAVDAILSHHSIDVANKIVSVVGQGNLVGKPTSTYFENRGATVHRIDEHTKDMAGLTIQSDIIVSGVGKPGLITSDMIKDGAVLLDAGTSSDSGTLKGDIDDECVDKAILFSKTPGGIGPLTIAILFKNFVTLATNK